jgi:hypothetical protein
LALCVSLSTDQGTPKGTGSRTYRNTSACISALIADNRAHSGSQSRASRGASYRIVESELSVATAGQRE